MNEWIDLMEGHTAWHRLLKYSQNERFTTQLESMEGSQCESIGQSLRKMHQRISAVPWEIFARLVEKLSGQNQTAFLSRSEVVLSPCCILWSWVRSESDFWTCLPHPKKFRNQKLNLLLCPRPVGGAGALSDDRRPSSVCLSVRLSVWCRVHRL